MLVPTAHTAFLLSIPLPEPAADFGQRPNPLEPTAMAVPGAEDLL